MKATGIIRRIDDLGRVSVPKEVRKSLSIKEGDALEIFISGEAICFIKYEPSESIKFKLSKLEDYIYDECESEPMKSALVEKINEMKEILKKEVENND